MTTCDAIKIKVTRFANVHASEAKCAEISWGSLVRKLESPKAYRTKGDCPLLKLGAFGELKSDKGAIRSDANLLEVSGIELDYDGGAVGLDEAAAKLTEHGIEGFFHTSATHTPEAPRWRLLVPLSKPCSPSERRGFVEQVNTALGGILAPESFTASQSYFYGRVEGAHYETRHIKGQPLDLCEIAPSSTKQNTTAKPERIKKVGGDIDALDFMHDKPPLPNWTLEEIESKLLAFIDPDMPYPEWIKVGQALHHQFDGGQEGCDLWETWSASGSKYQPGECERKWSSFSSSPRANGSAVTLASAIQMAKDCGAPTTSPFTSPLTNTTAAGKLQRALRALSYDELAALPPASWLIHKLLPERGLGMLYGPSGAGKSFALLDMGLSIARGQHWHGLRVQQGAVIHIAAEGSGGFRQRLEAYAKHHRITLSGVPYFVCPDGINLSGAEDVHAIISMAEQIAQAHGPVRLIVVDTLAASMTGDENSGADVGVVLRAMNATADHLGCLVMVCHHSGKDGTKGARGHSSIRAAMDVELRLDAAPDGIRTIEVTKMRDGADHGKYAIKLEPVTIGMTSEFEPIEVPVAVAVDVLDQKSTTGRPALWPEIVRDVVYRAIDGITLDVVYQLALDEYKSRTKRKAPRGAKGSIHRAVGTEIAAGNIFEADGLLHAVVQF